MRAGGGGNETARRFQPSAQATSGDRRSAHRRTSDRASAAAVVEAAAEAYISMDAGGTITGWNAAAEELFGWPRGDVVGRRLAETVVPARFRQSHDERIAALTSDSAADLLGKRLDLAAVRSDGREIPVSLKVTCLPVGAGAPEFHVFVSDRRAETYRELLLSLTMVLAESLTVEEAAPQLLAELGRALELDVGAFWLVGDDHEFHLVDTWSSSRPGLEEFASLTRAEDLPIRDGLPGRVLDAGTAVVCGRLDESAPRAAVARRAGLNTAIGLPLIAGHVVGVMEFFAKAAQAPDHALSGALETAGFQIGQFIARRRSERRLHEVQEQLASVSNDSAFVRALVDRSTALIYAKDSQGRFVFVNRAVEVAMNCSAAEMIGETSAHVVPESAVPALAENDRRVFEHGETVTSDEVVPGPDGDDTYYLSTKFPIVDPGGHVYALGAMSLDITAWRRAEHELADARTRFQEVVESIEQVFFTIDPEATAFSYLSPAFEHVFGADRETWAHDADEWRRSVHPDDRARIVDALAQNLAAGDFDERYRVVHPTRGLRWLRTRAYPVQGPAGEVIHYVGITDDVTAEHESAEALEAARYEAVRANGAKTEFLSRMSHELRTPLTAILGFAELLRDEVDSDRATADLELILAAGNHLHELINEALDISRIEQGGLHLRTTSVDLNSAIDEALAVLGPAARARNVTLQAPVNALGRVCADAQRLRQILLNLLSNAIKYNRDGGTVRVETVVLPDDRIRVAVHDNGIGIADQDLSKIFEPFERAGADNGAIEGSGLGLALATRLAEAMNGMIGAESKPGVGSTFWLDLPAVEQVVAP
jgi:PAS domain S-box-containing protein